ncbi:MAG: hypothetical protein IPJ65_26985 [Archangiaceae bacterium]|nr:hypothetical protein [Archangiaceae bacterium]
MFVFLPPDAPWANADFALGSVVEVVGTVSGLQTVGEHRAAGGAVWIER